MNDYSLTYGTFDWLVALKSTVESGQRSVLVTVLAVKGSTPREPGAKMLVQSAECVGTIGGGHLEATAIEKAREILQSDTQDCQQRIRVSLGATLGQCCGGHVELLIELVSANDACWIHDLVCCVDQNLPAVLVTPFGSYKEGKSVQPIRESLPVWPIIKDKVLYEPMNKKLFRLYLFGAGHVGKAVVQALQPLPCDIVWIDSRRDLFIGNNAYNNVHICVTDDPITEIQKITPNSFVVIMTHSHQLDYTITEQVLKQSVASYVGLIGSETKCRRFKQRLQQKGFSSDTIKNLVCPVGIDGIRGKHPSQIALSLSAQLLHYAENNHTVQNRNGEAVS